MFYTDNGFVSDDYFAPTRMSFGSHLEELRLRLWRALIGFALIVIVVLMLDFLGYATGLPIGIAKPVMDFITRPVQRELENFNDRRVAQVARELAAGKPSVELAEEEQAVPLAVEINSLARALAPRLGLPAPPAVSPEEVQYVTLLSRIPPVTWSLALNGAQRLVSRRDSLRAFSVSEGMVVYFKVALACGVVLGGPWILWQIWSFVGAGLYPNEKRSIHVYLPFSVALFLGGVLVCQFLVMPKAIEALLWFDEWLDFEPDLRLSEWLGFAVLMLVVFGVSFQTPLVMLFLARLGVFGPDSYRRTRRAAWFVLAIVAAVLTPSIDPYSMIFLWVPLGLLYELGIWLCLISSKKQPVLGLE